MSLMRNNQVLTQKQNKKPWNCEMASFLFTTNLHVTETLLKKLNRLFVICMWRSEGSSRDGEDIFQRSDCVHFFLNWKELQLPNKG